MTFLKYACGIKETSLTRSCKTMSSLTTTLGQNSLSDESGSWQTTRMSHPLLLHNRGIPLAKAPPRTPPPCSVSPNPFPQNHLAPPKISDSAYNFCSRFH